MRKSSKKPLFRPAARLLPTLNCDTAMAERYLCRGVSASRPTFRRASRSRRSSFSGPGENVCPLPVVMPPIMATCPAQVLLSMNKHRAKKQHMCSKKPAHNGDRNKAVWFLITSNGTKRGLIFAGQAADGIRSSSAMAMDQARLSVNSSRRLLLGQYPTKHPAASRWNTHKHPGAFWRRLRLRPWWFLC